MVHILAIFGSVQIFHLQFRVHVGVSVSEMCVREDQAPQTDCLPVPAGFVVSNLHSDWSRLFVLILYWWREKLLTSRLDCDVLFEKGAKK